MRDEYDFSNAKRGKVAKVLKVVKTFRLDPEVIIWLETESAKEGMGYQTFLNWFLRRSMNEGKSVDERLRKLERAVFKKRD